MIVNQNLKTVAIPLTVAASGVIGTAAATVDLASAFLVTATAAGLTLTLPAPTDTTAGDRVIVEAAAGSQPFTFYTTLVRPGSFAVAVWDGTGWRPLVAREPRISPNPTLGLLAPSGTISATASNTSSVAYTTADSVFVRYRWNGSINAGAWAIWTVPNITGYVLVESNLNFYYPNGIPVVAANVAQMDGGTPYAGATTIYRNHATARASVWLDVYSQYVRS